MRRKGLAALAAVSALALAGNAAARKTNDFRTPAGNIVCAWSQGEGLMACGVLSSGHVVVLPLVGKPWVYPRRAGDLWRSGLPVLDYGRIWNTMIGITCVSFRLYLECDNHWSGHSFRVARAEIQVD
jgi:hypothetical protein